MPTEARITRQNKGKGEEIEIRAGRRSRTPFPHHAFEVDTGVRRERFRSMCCDDVNRGVRRCARSSLASHRLSSSPPPMAVVAAAVCSLTEGDTRVPLLKEVDDDGKASATIITLSSSGPTASSSFPRSPDARIPPHLTRDWSSQSSPSPWVPDHSLLHARPVRAECCWIGKKPTPATTDRNRSVHPLPGPSFNRPNQGILRSRTYRICSAQLSHVWRAD